MFDPHLSEPIESFNQPMEKGKEKVSKEPISVETKKKQLEEKLALAKSRLQAQQEAMEAFNVQSRRWALFNPNNGLLREGSLLNALTETITLEFTLNNGKVSQFVIPKSFIKQQFKTYASALDHEFKDIQNELITIDKSLHPEAVKYAMFSAFQKGLVSHPFQALKDWDVNKLYEALPDLLEFSICFDCPELKIECFEFMKSQFEKSPKTIVDILELCLFSKHPEIQNFGYKLFDQLFNHAPDDVTVSELVKWVRTKRKPLPSKATLLIRNYFYEYLDIKCEIKQPFLNEFYLAYRSLYSADTFYIQKFHQLFEKEDPISPFSVVTKMMNFYWLSDDSKTLRGLNEREWEILDKINHFLLDESFNEPELLEDLLFMKSRLLLSEKKYLEGLKVADELIEKNPNSSKGYFLKAHHLNCLGEKWEALKNFDKMVQLCPDDRAFWERGEFRFRQLTDECEDELKDKSIEDCLKDFSQVIELDPHSSEAFLKRGQIYLLYKKEYNMALSNVKHASQFIKSLVMWQTLGQIHSERGEHTEAISAFKLAFDEAGKEHIENALDQY